MLILVISICILFHQKNSRSQDCFQFRYCRVNSINLKKLDSRIILVPMYVMGKVLVGILLFCTVLESHPLHFLEGHLGRLSLTSWKAIFLHVIDASSEMIQVHLSHLHAFLSVIQMP
jgi:hypothetical protein